MVALARLDHIINNIKQLRHVVRRVGQSVDVVQKRLETKLCTRVHSKNPTNLQYLVLVPHIPAIS